MIDLIKLTQLNCQPCLPVEPDPGPQQQRDDHESAEEGPDHDALVPAPVGRAAGGRRGQGAARTALFWQDGDVVGVDVDGDNVGELT